MIQENLDRTGKLHACSAKIDILQKYSQVLPDSGLTEFANCARHVGHGLDFTELPVIEAYRTYIIARIPTYTNVVTFNKQKVDVDYYSKLNIQYKG
jgi:hypothetical protein